MLLVSRCLSAAGVRFSVIRFPPGDWASLTVGLPGHRPDPDGVTTFHTHETRPGWVPPVPRGRRCSPDRSALSGRRLPLHSGQSLHPATASHLAGPSDHEASTEVHAIHPSGLPPRLWPPDGTGALGLRPRASHPAVTGDARQGRGQAIEHKPRTTPSTSADPPIHIVHSKRATSRRRCRMRLAGCPLMTRSGQRKESSVCCWLPIRSALGRLRSLNVSVASTSGPSMQSQACTLRA